MKNLALILFLITSNCFAKIEIAFLEIKRSDGKVMQLEENGRFAHVAIKYENKWLHVHPERGIELTTGLDGIGEVKEILVNESLDSLTPQQVSSLLGLPFDRTYNWQSVSSSYCSKLIAQLLNIKPSPMMFSASYWVTFKNLPRGELGISPDELYTELKKRNFKNKAPLCINNFLMN